MSTRVLVLSCPSSCPVCRRSFGVDSVGVVAVLTHQHQCKIGFHEVATEHKADVR